MFPFATQNSTRCSSNKICMANISPTWRKSVVHFGKVGSVSSTCRPRYSGMAAFCFPKFPTIFICSPKYDVIFVFIDLDFARMRKDSRHLAICVIFSMHIRAEYEIPISVGNLTIQNTFALLFGYFDVSIGANFQKFPSLRIFSFPLFISHFFSLPLFPPLMSCP